MFFHDFGEKRSIFRKVLKPWGGWGWGLVNRPRPCQHQCPIVLVHEPKRMQELVHGHNQPLVEAGRVQVHCLVPPNHPKLAFALRAWIDGHKVWTFGFSRDKGDTGEQVGEVVHRLPRQDSQLCEKYLCWFESKW